MTHIPATLREVVLVAIDQNFPGLGSVWWADDTVALHCIQKARGTAVSDAQTAL